MKYRVIYNNERIISIVENDSSITYTSDNVIVDTLYNIGVYLRTIGIDATMIDEFEKGII